MGMLLTPEPCIATGSSIQISVAKTSDIESYAVTTDGTPPVLAKYIAYDNLVPQNPFIATVEDGLGKVLMDGGFPKWYNDNYNSGWTSYSNLSPSYKYLFDALNYISNASKVAAGNKKVLIIGDAINGESYNIVSSGSGCFHTSLLNTITMAGYQPTFKTRSDYTNGIIDETYAGLDQYCCLLFFSTVYTSAKLITDACISNIVSYRQSGNGIFIITDHGDSIANLSDARTTNYSGFFRTANYLVTNFGCYFTGNYDRSPVNVGFLRTNYGNHPLWANLADTDYIYAGGSESRIVVTTFPLNYGSINLFLTQNGYIPVQFLMRYTDGSVHLVSYTYGLNVPEIIFPRTDSDIDFSNTTIVTAKDTFYINFRINYSSDCTGLIKLNTVVIGNFKYTKSTGVTDINLDSSYSIALYQALARNINVKNNNAIYIQMITPITYTKTLTIDFPVIVFDSLRFSKFMIKGYVREFTAPTYSSSPIRNYKRVIQNQDLRWWLKYGDTRFKARVFKAYFERNGQPGITNNLLTPVGGNPSGSQLLYKTFDFGSGVANQLVQISFDFIEIMSWDGEYFNVYGNDNIIAQKRYWVDSFYGNLDGDGTTNLSSINTAWPDEIHKFSLTSTTDASGKFKLGFGSTLDEVLTNKSFSVDNIKLLVRYSSEDFETNSNGWSNVAVWDSQGASKMLGLMGGTSGGEGYSKNYSFGISNANRKVKVSLQFYKVDSWDGEFFIIFANGVIVYKKSFVGTSYGNSDPSETGTKVTLNASSPSWNFEEYFNLSFEATTDASGNFRLGFGNTLDQPTWDEAAAVDNITIDLIFTEDFESGPDGWNVDTVPFAITT